ncbi:hypothetical protein [Burkholderia metallica]|uniref:hypothetical protein n=1 Tax=Burkholderia metallica TaxID=488729 RepID=UPI00131EACC7|nr:hypothetical protein [Burkholderia metallica]
MKTLEFDGHRTHRFTGRCSGITQQRKQMMVRRTRLRYDGSARRWTGADGEVQSNEAFDKRVINACDWHSLILHPVAEMCEAAKISCSVNDSPRRVDNALFNRLAHKNADRFADHDRVVGALAMPRDNTP